jgi:hypothetical protein
LLQNRHYTNYAPPHRAGVNECELLFSSIVAQEHNVACMSDIIDADKKQAAARLIEDLANCRITNFEFDDRFPSPRNDKALRAIHSAPWFLYDDLKEHRLEGGHALVDYNRAVCNRCILFLNTDHEHNGPPTFIHLTAPFKRLWNWLTRRTVQKEETRWWPFAGKEELNRAAQHAGADPRLYRVS